MADPNDNESNHQTDGKDPLQGGPLSRGRDEPPPERRGRQQQRSEASDHDNDEAGGGG